MTEVYLCRLAAAHKCIMDMPEWGNCGNCKIAENALLEEGLKFSGSGTSVNIYEESPKVLSLTYTGGITGSSHKMVVEKGQLIIKP